MEVLWVAGAIAVCVLFGWAATKIDPHWASKDGRRFLCNAQRLTARGEPQSRWRETRVMLVGGNQVQLAQKRFLRRSSSYWNVASRAEDPPRGKEVFLLKGFDATGAPAMMALRIPRKSRAVPQLASLIRH